MFLLFSSDRVVESDKGGGLVLRVEMLNRAIIYLTNP